MIEQRATDKIGNARKKFGNCFNWKYLKKPTFLTNKRKDDVIKVSQYDQIDCKFNI